MIMKRTKMVDCGNSKFETQQTSTIDGGVDHSLLFDVTAGGIILFRITMAFIKGMNDE